MKLIGKVAKSLLISLALLISFAPLFPARAQSGFTGPCVGIKYPVLDERGQQKRDSQGNLLFIDASDVPTIQGLECLVANILATAITLIGMAAFVMFLVGGFQFLTAGSNPKGMEQGRNSITFAILGIVVALASFLILNVIAQITGVKTILQFSTQLK